MAAWIGAGARTGIACVWFAATMAVPAAPAAAQDWWEGPLPPIQHAPARVVHAPPGAKEAPIDADAIEVRGLLGLGPGLNIDGWAKARQPGLPGRSEAASWGLTMRYVRLFPLSPHLVAGVGAESMILGASSYRAAVYLGPTYDFGFGSSQLAAVAFGAIRLVSPRHRAHLQVDGGFGALHSRTWFQADYPDPNGPAEVRGSTVDAVAVGRIGIELGARLVGAWPSSSQAGSHATFRLRLDWMASFEDIALRLPGDSRASAAYDPSAVMLSIGFGVAF